MNTNLLHLDGENMTKVYVVICYMEGCEECGNEHHVVGVFTNKQLAKDAQTEHEKCREDEKYGNKYHLHEPYVHIVELEIDKEYHVGY